MPIVFRFPPTRPLMHHRVSRVGRAIEQHRRVLHYRYFVVRFVNNWQIVLSFVPHLPRRNQ